MASSGWHRVTVLTFFALLWLPLAVTVAQPDAARSATEQRTLSGRPGIPADAASWRALPAALEAYYDDHIGLRNDMIRAWAWLHIELLGVSPSKSLIVGRDGWLFFGKKNAVAQARGLAKSSPRKLARWTRELERRRDWLRDHGIAYLVVFVPNKHRVYAEYLPASVPLTGEASTLDQLVAHLGRTTDVPVLDLRGPLERAKARIRIYHKTDTHWNDHGAYTAYVEILRRVSALLPGYPAPKPISVRRVDHVTPGLGLARIVGLARVYRELSHDLVVANPRAAVPARRRAAHLERVEHRLPFGLGTGDPDQPTALMFRDSFANALVPFLSENFRRIVYVWSQDIDPAAVEIEKPSIVIHEITERFLGVPPPDFERVLAEHSTSRRAD